MNNIPDAAPDLPVVPVTLDEDVARYLPHLNDVEMDEAHKMEFLRVLFAIMQRFVEIGFDVRACGQLLDAFNESSNAGPVALDSDEATSMEEGREEERL